MGNSETQTLADLVKRGGPIAPAGVVVVQTFTILQTIAAGTAGLAVMFPIKQVMLTSDQPALFPGMSAVLALTLLYLAVYGILIRAFAPVWHQPLRLAVAAVIPSLFWRHGRVGGD